jgi:hypothetical protein
LHIRRQQRQLDSLDGVIDNASVTFSCPPDQFDRVYKFTPLVPLSNMVGVSPCVFESVGVPAVECEIYRRDDEGIVHFPCTSHNAIKHAEPNYMIAASVSRRRIVTSTRLIIAVCSHAT